MLAEVTLPGIDLATLLPLLIKIGIPVLMLLMPQLKQPIVAILQSLLDALSDLPTVVKSTSGPGDAQTIRAWRTLRKRSSCPEHAKKVDEVLQNALTAEPPK